MMGRLSVARPQDWANAWYMAQMGIPDALRELELHMDIIRLEAKYAAADLRQIARVALTVEPEPSSYEIKHGAIPT